MELKRIVLQPEDQGHGLGRACVRLLSADGLPRPARAPLLARREGAEHRALALYHSEGFVEEGRLRESVRSGDGYDSLIVMSLLEREHAALVRAREQGVV